MTDYPTCSTCKHWEGTSDKDWTHNGRFRICHAVLMQKDTTEEEQATSLALVVDAEYYWAELITAPSFGCLLHSDLTSQ